MHHDRQSGHTSTGSSSRPDGSAGDSRPRSFATGGEPDELPVSAPLNPTGMTPNITPIEAGRRHEAEWSRTPNTTGSGAIHVRSFHCKLTDDALRYMDQAINEWLDAHPQYEVKFVTNSVGTLTGKLKEPHLICQVWV